MRSGMGHGGEVPIHAAIFGISPRGASTFRCADVSKCGRRPLASPHDKKRKTQGQGPGRARPGPCRFRCTLCIGTAASRGLGRVRRRPLPRPLDALAPEGHRCSPTASPSGLQDVRSVRTTHLKGGVAHTLRSCPGHPQRMLGNAPHVSRQTKREVQLLMPVPRGAIHRNERSREDGGGTVRFQNREERKSRWPAGRSRQARASGCRAAANLPRARPIGERSVPDGAARRLADGLGRSCARVAPLRRATASARLPAAVARPLRHGRRLVSLRSATALRQLPACAVAPFAAAARLAPPSGLCKKRICIATSRQHKYRALPEPGAARDGVTPVCDFGFRRAAPMPRPSA